MIILVVITNFQFSFYMKFYYLKAGLVSLESLFAKWSLLIC